ncbi:MAG: MATE family efflux transporter [Chloroflexota bacterium]|nr:MATE family efflux transporter [Chloroflexota bacterium]MDE2969313.1 MATE family efflux transporter [Chloroflexota bacterium]
MANLTHIALALVDTAMISRVSTEALAAAAVASSVNIAAGMLFGGWATAAQVIAARRFGEGRPADIGRLLDVSLLVGAGAGLMVLLALSIGAGPLLTAFGVSEAVRSEGVPYLRALACAAPLAGSTAMFRAVYAGMGETSAAMRMTFLVNAINIPLNYVLIFVAGWGLLGAGVGTAISIAAGCAYMGQFGWRRFRSTYELFRIGHLRQSRDTLLRLWTMGWPETAMLFLSYTNNVLVLRIVASLGTSVIAGMQVVTNIQQVIWTVIWALSTGVSIAVGHSLGTRDMGAVAPTERAGLLLMVAVPAVLLAPVLVAPSAILHLLTPDSAVVSEARGVLIILALQVPFMASSMTLAAVLRAAGDSKWIFYASTVSSYLVMVPLSWLLAIPLGWELAGVYVAGIAFFAARTGGSWWRYRQGKWRLAEI